MISREELYQLVWSKPMTKVAEQFGVSGSYMTRVCTMLNVPRPGVGYWAKLAFDKAPPPIPLPEARPGDTLFWSQDGQLPPPQKPQAPRRARKKPVYATAPKDATHEMIRGAKAHFEHTRSSYDRLYLKPYKRLLVDIISSATCLDKALGFANDLFNALEARAHRVTLAPRDQKLQYTSTDEREDQTKERSYYQSYRIWSPDRPTVVYVGSVAIGLSIIETSEEVTVRYVNGEYVRDSDYTPPARRRNFVDHSWTTTKELPTGRLRLKAYSPYPRVNWNLEWTETPNAQLLPKIHSIVRTLELAAADLAEMVAEADRQAEIAHQQWLIEEDKRRREDDRRCVERSFRESRSELDEIIAKWAVT